MAGRVVVAAAIIRDGRVLATRRRTGMYAGQWEFPGGKVEAGETDHEALVRECREELGLELTVGRRIGPDTPVAVGVLRLFAATSDGEPALTVHDAAAWCGARELPARPWIVADLGLVEAVCAVLRPR